ncbi:Aluminum-activated malate transporter 2 [Morus notabilis]|uniref:Aluminum-activated malate transporter 2 n=1 Tax=Morus notabilis TaxID=981085 RepID=W9T1G4_9ROSA|nr:aluminum-activated malate transporter 2 [Morus notabilis]EXC36056.1 Aluminum-activated malate transporter 2 [Morus notabilis]
MASSDQENSGTSSYSSSDGLFKALAEKMLGKVVEFSRKLKKLGQDDPRRIIHSLKVGLAITLVSLFYYFKPLYDGFGVNAIWAVLTVVVVFEFSVGATLGRGLNRMLATLLAGGLGLGTHRLATLSGETGEPILIAVFVFVIAAIVTFLRFLPQMKVRYDYGLMMFILTFCLVSVSGYRDDEVIKTAFRRLTTITTGSITTVIVCTFICPVWIGVELHKVVAGNLEKLGNFLEGFAGEYFQLSEAEDSRDKSFLEGYKSVLTSKGNEENMANLARWEPRHGQFRFNHPWKQYLKVSNLARQCAYKIEALHGYLQPETQTPQEDRSKIQEPCKIISSECGKALKELASTMKKMRRSSALAEPHIAKSKVAIENLKTMLKSGQIWKDSDILEITPAAAVASLLMEVVSCTENIAEAVRELESLAHFKSPKPRVTPEDPPQVMDDNQQGAIIGAPDDHVITVNDGPSDQYLMRNPSSVAEGSRIHL